MEIDINEIVAFFNDYKEKPMPKVARDLILRKGKRLKFGQLESGVLELIHLRDIFAPEIAKIMDAKYGGNNMEVPTFRIVGAPENFVYDPTTGEYLGKFEVKRK